MPRPAGVSTLVANTGAQGGCAFAGMKQIRRRPRRQSRGRYLVADGHVKLHRVQIARNFLRGLAGLTARGAARR